MGVTGLLPNLKEIQKPTSLENFKGKTLAVDTYGWLHRGLVSCAQELCQDVPTRKYINSVMKKIDMLRYFGVEPYLVFDGAYLPTKAETAKERRLKREAAKAKADLLVKQGNKKLAWKEFMKAAGVTPQMAKSIMLELDLRKVKYVVAPYEADPQMVYLEKIGVVDGILSEDSDLLIFGCNRLITKLDDYGKCVEICKEDFGQVKSIPNLSSYTPSQLRLVAILSGCDYTKGVPGIGLKTAFVLVRRFGDIKKILESLKTDGKNVPSDFESEAHKADIAFQFQKVFNPIEQRLKSLNEVPEEMAILSETQELIELCCGKTLEHEIHVEICNGKIHPNTYETLVSREQSLTMFKSRSIGVHSNKKVSGEGPVLASKSKSAPKIGSIDSFFGMKSNLQPSIPITKSSLLSLPLAQKRDITSSRTDDGKHGNHSSVSPTTKKIRKVLEPSKAANIQAPSISNSKFFNSLLATGNSKPAWDVSEDSEIPDDFSSSPLKTKVQESSLKQEVTKSEKSVSITKQELDYFDVDIEDSDIDESPVKKATESPQKRLVQFGKSLYERFSMKSFTGLPSPNSSSDATKSGSSDLNTPANIDKQESSLLQKSPNIHECRVPTPKSDNSVSDGLIDEEDEVEDEETNDIIDIKKTKIIMTKRVSHTVDLQRFAYKG